MIKLKANNKTYKLLTEWDEITAAKAIELDNIEVPAKLMKVIKQPDEDLRTEILDSVNDAEEQEFLQYYRKALAVLGDLPDVEDDQISTLFTINVYPLIYQMKHLAPDIEPKLIQRYGFRQFKHMEIGGEQIAMVDMNIDKFTDMSEMAQNVEGIVWAVAAMLTKSDQAAVKKYNRLQKESMFKIWQLFFYISQYQTEFTTVTRDYSAEAKPDWTSSGLVGCSMQWLKTVVAAN